MQTRRRALGLTQAALAERLGVTPNTLARWERGKLQRMMSQIPLTDDERAAVEDGTAAVERLIERLNAFGLRMRR